jgi:hypothetical protein
MTRRHSIYVSRRLPVPPTPPPNNGVSLVTTEIRIFAPPNTPANVLASELYLAVLEAGQKLELWPMTDRHPLHLLLSALTGFGPSPGSAGGETGDASGPPVAEPSS